MQFVWGSGREFCAGFRASLVRVFRLLFAVYNFNLSGLEGLGFAALLCRS